MASLSILDGALKGQRFTLEQPVTRIGRREGNDWVLPDNSISGSHCEVEKTSSGFVIRDLGSTNGTKVNGDPTKEKALFRNDIILLGEVPAMIEGDDVPLQKLGDTQPITRTTITIQQPKRTVEPPPEFEKKSNTNKVWVLVITVLVLVIAFLLFKLLTASPAAA
ncbi:MAG: FHA domain-containing protein [Verrucomicrobiota bacterium]|jgi:predicted component of type VI protein secretion system|nr:FHA domain-containing protein [Verrucomicrobiota bacterium]